MTSAARRTDGPQPPPGEPCLDAALVAAYIDRTIDDEGRAVVEAHLARCAACREWVAETVIALEDVDETTGVAVAASSASAQPGGSAMRRPGVPAASRGTRVLRRAAVTAAALFVAGIGILIATLLRSASPEPIARDLVDAVEDARYFEPRVSLAFPPATWRGSASGPSGRPTLPAPVRVEIARAERFVEEHPYEPAGFALAGIARMLDGRHDEAITALLKATNDAPDRREWKSDLAAAYVARGMARKDTDDLGAALGITRALNARPPAMPEALYNEALALTTLAALQPTGSTRSPDPREAAVAAWQRYLAADTSRWSSDGRDHLAALGVR